MENLFAIQTNHKQKNLQTDYKKITKRYFINENLIYNTKFICKSLFVIIKNYKWIHRSIYDTNK